MSNSLITHNDSSLSIESFEEPILNHSGSYTSVTKDQDIVIEDFSPQEKKPVAPAPTQVIEEEGGREPNKKRVLSKLKRYYAKKHPLFNVEKYMTERIANQENRINTNSDQEDFEDYHLLRDLKKMRALEKEKKARDRFYYVSSKVNTNIKPLQLKQENMTPIKPKIYPPSVPKRAPEMLGNSNAFFITEQINETGTFSSKRNRFSQLDNSFQGRFGEGSATRTNRSSFNGVILPKDLFDKRVRSAHSNAFNSSKYSHNRSFDINSDISKMFDSRKIDDVVEVPKKFCVDTESKFRFLYQKFKNPELRAKNGSKRQSGWDRIRDSYLVGPNTTIIEEVIAKARSAKLSKIEEKSHILEDGIAGSIRNTINDVGVTTEDEFAIGKKYNELKKKVLNLRNTSEGFRRKKYRLDQSRPSTTEKAENNNSREPYGKSRREIIRPKTVGSGQKQIDQSLRTLKSLFDEYTSIKIDLGSIPE